MVHIPSLTFNLLKWFTEKPSSLKGKGGGHIDHATKIACIFNVKIIIFGFYD
jgi:hypothetical protein